MRSSDAPARERRELLSLAGASFGYDGRAVVAGVDLVVRAGDFVGIVGPNGAGKTTLFRGMLGLLPALAGRVVRAHGALGYVPQRETLDALFPLTVREVVELGAPSGRARGEAEALLERVGLAERRRAAFASLSGGQRQRALIARALMVRPELLLLDEPTSGVDRQAVVRILELLARLNEGGLAVLLVSHQLPLVREAVQRVLWVADGRVRAGAPDELLAPENLDRLFAGA